MAYTPLIVAADLSATPLADTISAFSAQSQTDLCVRASRTVESYCKRRLTPFTGVPEVHTARMIDINDSPDSLIPLDATSQLGLSRAQSLNSASLVRHFRLREYPPLWPDLWTGSVTSVTLWRTFGGTATIDPTSSAFEFHPENGAVVLPLGTYCPKGARVKFVYSGGYSTTPDELKQAAMYEAVALALLDLEPSSRPDIEIMDLRAEMAKLLSEYVRIN